MIPVPTGVRIWIATGCNRHEEGHAGLGFTRAGKPWS